MKGERDAMKRKATTLLVAFVVTLAMCYAAGAFTSELRTEEGCTLCRSVRYAGHHYGVGFARVEDSPFTVWYRSNIDSKHGLALGHPHNWVASGCTRRVRSGFYPEEKECVAVPPMFNLRPEILLEVVQRVPDTGTQVAIIRSLNSADEQANAQRVNLLIDYHYVASSRMSWRAWWRQNAAQFGVTPPAV
jgi:hypothetical protein